ncbi:carboxymuconolactone decarboxylase family protein [Cupriavidus sp. CuC1]|uniref:carboxymuconolactone decarboxylase family protein n=1 Tax=Cupriavidus sp. CuC1 TaxID=3373131 RepID=UPI0037D2E798
MNNGLTRAEIGEIFLQASIYCGLPASSDATRVAKRRARRTLIDNDGVVEFLLTAATMPFWVARPPGPSLAS